MGIFILYTRRKSKVRRFFFKFSSNLQVGGISILLLREGGVPVGGGVVRCTSIIYAQIGAPTTPTFSPPPYSYNYEFMQILPIYLNPTITTFHPY